MLEATLQLSEERFMVAIIHERFTARIMHTIIYTCGLYVCATFYINQVHIM